MESIVNPKRVCINCSNPVSQVAYQCRSCFHKSTRGRKAWNEGIRVDYTKCIDCESIRYAVKGSPRCQSCWNKYLKENLNQNSLKNLFLYRDKVAEINRKNPPHLGKKHSEETKIKLSAKKQGVTLENWIGFTKSINSRVRESVEYEDWRKKCMERDHYTCCECNQVGGQLEVDHIKSFAYYPDLRFDINNGRTLCKICHRKTDTWGWRTRWNQSG